MYSMIPFSRKNLIDRASELFDDRFVRSFFNMNDLFGSAGFRVDIREKGDSYVLEAELPGIPRDKIDLSVENDVLTVSAEYESASAGWATLPAPSTWRGSARRTSAPNTGTGSCM